MNARLRPRSGPFASLAKCLVVAVVYALANAAAAVALGPFSRMQPTWDNLLVWLLAGILLCLALSPFVLRSSWSRLDTVLAVWGVMVSVRSLGLGIEGSLFKPTQARIAIIGTLVGILVSLLVAWLLVQLLFANAGPLERGTKPRPWWGWLWRVLLVGLAYFLFYFGFGAANAMLYTRSFYESNPQYGLVLPPTSTIFLAELIRGPLFGLGSLLLARSTEMPRRQTGLWLGLALFVLGGLAPYLETTFRTMPLGFNLATLLELFLQNFLTGVVAARLYK